MACGHLVYDTCILRYSTAYAGTEELFLLKECILYKAPNKTFIRIKPPTAGVRILYINGGGTRGVVPLESLYLL